MPVQFEPSPYQSKIYDAAVAVVKAKFPDYINSVDTKVTPTDRLPYAVQGNYNLEDKNIQISAPKDIYSGFTTDAVINVVGTILHEIHHARDFSKSGGQTSSDRSFAQVQGVNKENYVAKFMNLVNTGEKEYLPSMGKDTSQNFTEFMATAVPTMDMKDRGIQGQYLKNVENIIKQIPEIEDAIKANRYPEVQTFK